MRVVVRVHAAVGHPHADRGLRSHPGHRGDDVPVGVLEHGVAPLQGRQRGQRPGAGPVVARCRRAPGPAGGRGYGGRGREARCTSSARSSSRLRGSPSTGRERSASRPACSRASQPPSACRSRCRAASTQPELLGDVGDDQLGGVGRGRGADVGDEVEQRLVLLVADRRDDGRAQHVDGADQRLVGERQQVLDGATAAGDHDDVDLGVAVEPARAPPSPRRRRAGPAWWRRRPRRRRSGQRRRALSSTSRSAADSGRGDQPDPVGQERQRPLQLAGEQPLGREQLAALLEPGQQLAEADHPDLADRERERAAVGVVGRLGEHDHAGALDQGRGQAVDRSGAGRSAAPRCRPRRRAAS